MQNAIKPLLDSELLSEEAQQEITEAWESKLNEAKEDVIFVPGKVLNSGEFTSGKKLKVYALGFSEKAKEKLKKAGCDCKLFIEVLKSLKKGDKLKGEIIN